MAKILFFGRLQDVLATSDSTLDIPSDVKTTTDLREHLDQIWGLKGALLEETVRIAINGEMVLGGAPVSNKDEIAFMPPVGGG